MNKIVLELLSEEDANRFEDILRYCDVSFSRDKLIIEIDANTYFASQAVGQNGRGFCLIVG